MLINPVCEKYKQANRDVKKEVQKFKKSELKKKPSIPLKRIIRETTVTTYFKLSGIWKTNPENHST